MTATHRFCLLTAALAASLAACTRSKPPASEVWETMGTFAQVSVPAAERAALPGYTRVARETFAAINDLLTVYTTNSELSAFNAVAGSPARKLHPHTLRALAEARRYAELSGGAFDPTVAPLVSAWGFNGAQTPEHPLPPETLRAALANVGWQHLVLSNGTARLDRPGMQVDLGGIAKGYAVDVAFEQLLALGARNVMVDLGGNLRCAGRGRAQRPWTIGVRHPFDREAILGTVELTNGQATATSGNYEKFVEIEGKLYAHIIDPRSGLPVTGMAGVTVISTNATETDGLSTALFVLGVEGSRALLQRLPHVDALLVEDKQPPTLLVTPGFQRRFKPAPEHAAAVRPLW